MLVKDVLKMLNRWIPVRTAADWDNVGLQLGQGDDQVSKILVALDFDHKTLDKALEQEANLVITHHPLIFKPLSSVTNTDHVGNLVLEAVRNRINVISMHTNLDVAANGVSTVLAERLGLTNHKVMVETYTEKLYKLAVMVPDQYQERVRSALCQAGAGSLGNYTDCTFSYVGTGTFKPNEGAKPFIGSLNELEKVAEVKIETVVPESSISKVLNGMFQAHPYEEVAYDLFLLANKGTRLGFGVIGNLPEPLRVEELLVRIKKVLDCGFLRVAGYYPEQVKRVAILGGSGADYIRKAADAGADAFITADIKYHQAHEAESLGLLLVDPGHDVMETPIIPVIVEYLLSQDRIKSEHIPVISTQPTKPVFGVF